MGNLESGTGDISDGNACLLGIAESTRVHAVRRVGEFVSRAAETLKVLKCVSPNVEAFADALVKRSQAPVSGEPFQPTPMSGVVGGFAAKQNRQPGFPSRQYRSFVELCRIAQNEAGLGSNFSDFRRHHA